MYPRILVQYKVAKWCAAQMCQFDKPSDGLAQWPCLWVILSAHLLYMSQLVKLLHSLIFKIFLCEVSKLNLTTNISVSLSGGSGVVIQGTKLFLKSQWNNVTGAPGVLDIDNRPADWLLECLQQQLYTFVTLLPMNDIEQCIFNDRNPYKMWETAFSEVN